MAYNVKYTDSANNPDLIVDDGVINDTTSLSFPGRNTNGYGQIIAENFLHLLENFANTTAPEKPIKGQLWFDSNTGVSQLKVNVDGTPTGWQSAGGLKKGATEPVTEASIVGDLWVDTTRQQLYLFTGSRWILVGPEYSSGTYTGAIPKLIIDTANVTQTVVAIEVLNEIVAIISTTSFTPKSTITGFSYINTGVTLNSNYNKYYGIAEKAEALLVSGVTVPGSSFLRSDTENNTTKQFNVKNAAGVSIGEDSQLRLYVEGTSGVLLHKTSGSHLDIRVNTLGDINTVMRIDSGKRVGINTTNPQEALDVFGNIATSGTLKISDFTESTSPTTGALVVSGGVGIAQDLHIGGTLQIVGEVTTTNNIIPLTTSGANLGSNSKKFNNVYANSLNGTLYGNVIGTVTGNVSGSASTLVSSTTFTIAGDVSSTGFTFNGAGGDKTFQTTISESFVTNKPAITSLVDADELLIYRNDQGLRKITKSNLWSSIPQFPIGSVISYAGTTAPNGWLFCDGSEVKTSDFTELFDTIGYTYGDVNILEGLGTFKLPDLRARNPMGVNTMDNNITVPSKANPNVQIQPGGGATDRVTLIEAQSVGLGAGTDEITIDVDNLPDHEHDLKGNADNQYYAFRNISGTPADTDAISGFGSSASGLGQYLPTSGGILTTTGLNDPINIMNPFLSLNYIIYTGQGA
jgi:microcystin-dependent protein